MSEKIEKFVYYLLGIVGGVVASCILDSMHLSYFSHHPKISGAVIGGLVGLLVAIALHEFKREKALRENTRLRNEAVTLITHEMRTGLTSTSWAIQLVLQNYGGVIEAKDKKMLEEVVSSIYTTVMHSVNLLDVSLLDVKKLLISLKWVNLAEVDKLFRDTIEKYTFGARQKDINLSADIKLDHKRQVEVDMMRLRIILENLLENAFQYIRDDKREIEVTIKNTPNALNMVVKDTGIGIPIMEQEKIFSEFYRATNARRKLSNGSGIGLFMSEQYVRAHRGTIRFESKEGEGTTFFISIPLKTNADVEEFLTKI